MKVLKFGGTSVGSAKNINKVISILEQQSQDSKLAVVVSAVGGITDNLLDAGNLACSKDEAYLTHYNAIASTHKKVIEKLFEDFKTDKSSQKKHDELQKIVSKKLDGLKKLLDGIYLINELSPKTKDKLLSYGEMLSSTIIQKTLASRNLDVVLKNSQELITTDLNFNNAAVNFEITNANINTFFTSNANKIVVLPGFVSKSLTGELTTLGRGGSDYTSAIIAAATSAEELQIWTDVSGMFTANPKLVKHAKPITNLTYQEAVELSHFGAKVLYPPTVMPVLRKQIPIVIKNTLQPDAVGTTVSKEHKPNGQSPVKGISNIDHVALLTLQGNGMVGIPGFSKRLFETLAQEKINIILITQSSSEHSICFGISEHNALQAKTAIDTTFEYEIALKKIDPIIVETDLSIIAVVGDNMKSHQGISGKTFSTLGKNNVNIRAIAQGASERNISAVIHKNDVKKSLNALHERFFEVKTKQINLFITGVGNVGERLIDQIQQQQSFLKKNLQISLRIVGMSNSRKMVFKDDGINLEDWVSEFDFAEKSSINGFYKKAVEMNLRNSIFVDVTASEQVANIYSDYLKHSIAVVACSKIACSKDYETYKNLHDLSKKYNTPFLYETNVGAALPIINTLNNLVSSGDKVTNIQAVLSGSLNFVFNNFSDKNNFHDTVKRAQFEGYTEPDPRIDLSGIDVARKVLILARENGAAMEIEDIEVEPFLTKANLASTSVDDFYETLQQDEAHFQKLYASAEAKNCQLKYVAEYDNGKAKVGLQEIPEGHPFFNLEGKDNIVMFYTQRYPRQPLIVKGAGAGADVTASGLFADIIRIANN
ncbi:bifunctional aspartate kinase/homoserine dehydrogenase I [Winogradskyella luteola]|uniref:Bifunctional aspartate kinase/homoserine dehydrogenase I n=1 Tax=Winogradskyella luteola TaxID=2828330 RepID=A0A9X1F7K4_9FLAO|nr:bifunctional aspartate kinase/homoserine dehydrogenase I [Winogradskyella luteola]MBV7268093.1 bifunctional aspartate kinase/homoserine dehydrogenase I [Winogradskyella luteola]